MLKCANCGAENAGGFRFCEQCGASIETPPSEAPVAAVPPIPYYGAGGWKPYYPVPNAEKAVIAFILGIAGLLFCPGVLSIPALVLGKISRDEIRRSQGALGGSSYATAGIILGIIGIVIVVLAVAVIAIGVSLNHVH